MCDTVFSHKTSHTSPRKIKEIMDEMICRGRCVTDHTWSYGFLFETAYDCGCAACIGYEPISANDYGELYPSCYDVVDPNTVGRYTGLMDRNGVRIFEGDIIEFDYRGMKRFPVVFQDGMFKAGDTSLITWTCDPVRKAHVVGNVYEDNNEIEGYKW